MTNIENPQPDNEVIMFFEIHLSKNGAQRFCAPYAKMKNVFIDKPTSLTNSENAAAYKPLNKEVPNATNDLLNNNVICNQDNDEKLNINHNLENVSNEIPNLNNNPENLLKNNQSDPQNDQPNDQQSDSNSIIESQISQNEEQQLQLQQQKSNDLLTSIHQNDTSNIFDNNDSRQLNDDSQSDSQSNDHNLLNDFQPEDIPEVIEPATQQDLQEQEEGEKIEAKNSIIHNSLEIPLNEVQVYRPKSLDGGSQEMQLERPKPSSSSQEIQLEKQEFPQNDSNDETHEENDSNSENLSAFYNQPQATENNNNNSNSQNDVHAFQPPPPFQQVEQTLNSTTSTQLPNISYPTLELPNIDEPITATTTNNTVKNETNNTTSNTSNSTKHSTTSNPYQDPDPIENLYPIDTTTQIQATFTPPPNPYQEISMSQQSDNPYDLISSSMQPPDEQFCYPNQFQEVHAQQTQNEVPQFSSLDMQNLHNLDNFSFFPSPEQIGSFYIPPPFLPISIRPPI
ncbi:hypothetical protein TRFO_31705 [Tritrichomonas foetus]|uniref:Uncharacterized protein n=1 Tax=Tritrichomonas foetus TaxID=1144522 RepID=A0A1J4JW12_9EUKA|nr:hypothetical protein TRFO_31705 [Tritrichomonas foetus]|eukprot:OHT01477.1 hypothetical protein TRFO_31705 [Tritrichomonas foetus]